MAHGRCADMRGWNVWCGPIKIKSRLDLPRPRDAFLWRADLHEGFRFHRRSGFEKKQLQKLIHCNVLLRIAMFRRSIGGNVENMNQCQVGILVLRQNACA